MPQIEADFQWLVLASPGDSDHFPIVIVYEEEIQAEINVKWCIKKARYDIYGTSAAWRNIPSSGENSIEELKNDIQTDKYSSERCHTTNIKDHSAVTSHRQKTPY